MLEIYTIYGGGMWKTALDAVVTLIGSSTFSTLMRMAGTFGVLAALIMFIKQRNPMLCKRRLSTVWSRIQDPVT